MQGAAVQSTAAHLHQPGKHPARTSQGLSGEVRQAKASHPSTRTWGSTTREGRRTTQGGEPHPSTFLNPSAQPEHGQNSTRKALLTSQLQPAQARCTALPVCRMPQLTQGGCELQRSRGDRSKVITPSDFLKPTWPQEALGTSHFRPEPKWHGSASRRPRKLFAILAQANWA